MLSESQNIEYKESWHDEYLKWICGFANAQGGTLYIGVNDDKQVVGVKNSKKLMEDIPNKVSNYLGIVPEVNLLTEDGMDYIQIEVSPSNIPISYLGHFHYRSGSTKQELKGIALQQFILKKMGRDWDDIVVPGTSVDDVDHDIIDYFLRNAIGAKRVPNEDQGASAEKVLRNLELLDDSGNLKAAALLMFTDNPGHYFPAVQFKIGRFHTTESNLIIQDLIEGNILQMADKVMNTLQSKYLVSPIHYEGFQRKEVLEIPEDALREVIYNAIVHKDYTGAPIQMRVYDDHISIWNPGRLPQEITPEDLLDEHASNPRNKNIANTFFKAGFIESWGRGYDKIKEALRKAGMPMPIVKDMQGGVMVILKRRPMSEIIAHGDKKWPEYTDSKETNVSSKVTDVSSDVSSYVSSEKLAEMTDRQKAIVDMIKRNPYITAKEMSVELSVVVRTIYRDLSSLQKLEIIRHEGNTSAGVWVILE